MTTTPAPLRLGLNLDHVATLRNARGGAHPDPVRFAHLALEAGADAITVHLREDRRHIRDADVERLMAELTAPLNLEMAVTAEMVAIARRLRPHAVCLVPEKRQEVTTEGGLDAVGGGRHWPRPWRRWPMPAAACRCSSTRSRPSSMRPARLAHPWSSCIPAPIAGAPGEARGPRAGPVAARGPARSRDRPGVPCRPRAQLCQRAAGGGALPRSSS